MANFNKVILIGRLTRDVETKQINGGQTLGKMSLAVNRIWYDKEKEKHEEVLFIDVTVWGKTAEHCAQYLHKGSSIHVDGYLKLESWEDKTTGEKRQKISVNADHIQFLDGKPAESSDSPPPAQDAPRPEPRKPETRQPARSAPVRAAVDDSDIPF